MVNNCYSNFEFRYIIDQKKRHDSMYKGTNVRQHNLAQLQKAKQFLANNNLATNATPAAIDNAHNQQQQQNDSLWADMQKMVEMANLKKMSNQPIQSEYMDNKISSNNQLVNTQNYSRNQNIIKKVNSFNEPSYQTDNCYNYHNTKGYKSATDINYQTDTNQPNYEYNQNQYWGHKFSKQINKYNQFDDSYTDSEQQGKKVNKKKNGKKEKKKGKQIEQQCYNNVIKQKNPNLFTIQNLRTQQPVTKNYKMAKRDEWQKNSRIQDYKLQFVLRKFPRIKDYRNNQKAIIKCSLLGNDVFVCMPTGGGKSLTFQAMTFIEKGVYLCILPLVSLIIDQEEQAKKIGIKAYSLTGSKQIQDNRIIYQQLLDYQLGGQSIVIFCTPEKVNKSPQFFNVLQTVYDKKALVKIVIDEVHCVSTWGKQFRHEYENLSTLRKSFPNTPILGLTATVTEIIKQDIIKRLGIQNCYYFQSSFNRPNLYYEVCQKNKDVLSSIIKVIMQYENKSGIIYCISRKDCQQMCSQLQQKRFKVAFYHANISQNQKRQIQSQWMDNKIQIIIATIAFGMGINKPDVRFVIHHSLSKSLQNYYQQSGRAGRDGQAAKCVLFYKKGDKISLQSLIMKNQISNNDNKNFCMRQLSNMIKYCQDKYTCRRKFQLQYLGEKDFNQSECNKTCDNCKRGLKFVQIQCINQAKFLVNFMISIEKIKQSLSQNQIIMICKGSTDKKFRYKLDQIQRCADLSQLKEIFSKWNKSNIDQLITQLCSYEIFYQKIFTTNIKNNVVSNFYLKVNYPMANKFLNRVQTLPLKRNFSNKKNSNMQNNQISQAQFDFEDEEKIQNEDPLGQKFEQNRYSFHGSKKSLYQNN